MVSPAALDPLDLVANVEFQECLVNLEEKVTGGGKVLVGSKE